MNTSRHPNRTRLGSIFAVLFAGVVALACNTSANENDPSDSQAAALGEGNPEGTRWNGNGYTKCLNEAVYKDGTPYLKTFKGTKVCARRYPKTWSNEKQNAFDEAAGSALRVGRDGPADGDYDLNRPQSATCVPWRNVNVVEPLVYKEYRFRTTNVAGYGSSRILVGWSTTGYPSYVFATDDHYDNLIRVLGHMDGARVAVEDYATGKYVVGGACVPMIADAEGGESVAFDDTGTGDVAMSEAPPDVF